VSTFRWLEVQMINRSLVVGAAVAVAVLIGAAGMAQANAGALGASGVQTPSPTETAPSETPSPAPAPTPTPTPTTTPAPSAATETSASLASGATQPKPGLVFSCSGSPCFAKLGSYAYFGAGLAGDYELWRTDGTSAGTWQVTRLGVPNNAYFGVEVIDILGPRILFGSYALAPNMWVYVARLDGIGTTICASTVAGVPPCPCSNFGTLGRGCVNSAAGSPGGRLDASGTTNPDTVLLTATEVFGNALSVFLQGTTLVQPGVSFGDGVRCVGGSLKRLYLKNASNGVVLAPEGLEPSISARSAALGDPIAPGSVRYYQVYYRDPVLAFCPAPTGNSWNVTSGVSVSW